MTKEKLHVVYKDSIKEDKLKLPRKYTLTHSDSTGDLFLTIGAEYDLKQISGLYTRFMRDEVLAEWQKIKNDYELHIFMHVSGGFCFGWARLRNKIFCYHLPLVLQTIRCGDKKLIQAMPEIENSRIIIHFQSKNKKYDRIENYGQLKDIFC